MEAKNFDSKSLDFYISLIKMQIVFLINNIRKTTPEDFHIFVIFFTITDEYFVPVINWNRSRYF